MSRYSYASLLDSDDGLDEALFDTLMERVASRPLPAPSAVPDLARETAHAQRVAGTLPTARARGTQGGAS